MGAFVICSAHAARRSVGESAQKEEVRPLFSAFRRVVVLVSRNVTFSQYAVFECNALYYSVIGLIFVVSNGKSLRFS